MGRFSIRHRVVGRLNLLALDKDGNYVVIELKVGRVDERAIAQTMRYMGWVQRELSGGQPVRGILIAREFSDGPKFAAVALPSLTLKEYRVAFSFNTADLAPTPPPSSWPLLASRKPSGIPLFRVNLTRDVDFLATEVMLFGGFTAFAVYRMYYTGASTGQRRYEHPAWGPSTPPSCSPAAGQWRSRSTPQPRIERFGPNIACSWRP
jgi:hypothetical protein